MKEQPSQQTNIHYTPQQRVILLERLQQFEGSYECHITVKLPPNDHTALAAFQKQCQLLQAKPVLIILSNGNTPTQPMLSKVLTGQPDSVEQAIHAMVETLNKSFHIERVKIEVDPTCLQLPQTQTQAEQLPTSCYFEHHVKIQLPIDTNLHTLRQSCKRYDGHLSKNAIHKNSANHEQRFITQRFRTSDTQAQQGLKALLDYLNQPPFAIKKVIREFNIFDSHADLDQGWMT